MFKQRGLFYFLEGTGNKSVEKCFKILCLHLSTEKKCLEGSKQARHTGQPGMVAQPVTQKTGEAKAARLSTLKPAWLTLGVQDHTS